MNDTRSQVIEHWHFVSHCEVAAFIVPDGCRDLILRQCPGERPQLLASSLDSLPRVVRIRERESFHGIRLRPGIGIDSAQLQAMNDDASERLVHEGIGLERLINEKQSVCTALQAIAVAGPASEVALDAVASDLGISLRTLQRTVGLATGRSPRWWRRLARARRAAARIVGRGSHDVANSLSEIAYESGFADQAHLTRELKRWFSMTPSDMRHSDTLTEQLRSPGYATEAV